MPNHGLLPVVKDLADARERLDFAPRAAAAYAGNLWLLMSKPWRVSEPSQTQLNHFCFEVDQTFLGTSSSVQPQPTSILDHHGSATGRSADEFLTANMGSHE